jgi:immune inhibitor A
MAQSRLNAPGEALGTRPGDLSAWDKLQLGWLDYEIVPAGTERTLNLGPHEYNSKRAQAVVVPLPAKKVTTELGAPASGSSQWYSDQGDDLNTTLTRSVALGAGTSTLSMKARWNIEEGYDYAFVEVNDGSGWATLPSPVGDPAASNGIDGVQATYAPLSFDLSQWSGKTVQLRLRYTSDGGVQGQDSNVPWAGFFADDISLTSGSATLFTDGAETADPAWTTSGFKRVASSVTDDFANYYLASNRTYTSYDRWLETGPYNFGFLDRPDWVEHFSYQPGLLVSYWDTSESDNNTSQHPGSGLVLPVDAHPAPIYRIDGQPWRGRIQVYDATFSNRRPPSMTLHVNGVPSYVRGQNAVPVFDDRKSYWNEAIPQSSVKVPNAGVRMRVVSQSGTSLRLRIVSTK